MGAEEAFRNLCSRSNLPTDFNRFGHCRLYALALHSLGLSSYRNDNGVTAGSTTGGIKCIRMVILFKIAKNEFKDILHPNAVLPVRVNKQVISPSIQSTVLAFTFLYAIIAIISILVMMGFGVDFSGIYPGFAVISAIEGMGPGLRHDGSAFVWSELPDAAKWLLSFLMLLGRLS